MERQTEGQTGRLDPTLRVRPPGPPVPAFEEDLPGIEYQPDYQQELLAIVATGLPT